VIAEEFGISKTPVREALVQLQREGLIVVIPHSGTFVFEMTNSEVAELCELRLIMETNALQLAIQRHRGQLLTELEAIVRAMKTALKGAQTAQYRVLDSQFHGALFKHCGNKYLAASYSLIEAKLQTLRVSLTTPIPRLTTLSMDEHVQILNTLSEAEVPKALKILSGHIRRARDLMQGLHEVDPVNVATIGNRSSESMS
jgi:DNA-binding GntR family transcriptional regulator